MRATYTLPGLSLSEMWHFACDVSMKRVARAENKRCSAVIKASRCLKAEERAAVNAVMLGE